MAVQAQYPSNFLFLNRNLQESNKANNFAQSEEACLDQIQSSNMMLFNSNGNANHNNKIGNGRSQRKRGRDTSSGLTTAPVDTFSGFLPQQQQQQQHQMVDMSQLHHHNNNILVSTGLKLSFPDHHQRQLMTPDPNHSSFLAEHINHQMKQQRDDIEHLLHFQEEQLRRVLSENRQRQYRALLTAAEQSVFHRLSEKQSEYENAVRRNSELEARAVHLSKESQLWQAKTRAQESAAVSLQYQLQQAMIDGRRRVGDEMEQCQADDAESVYTDPDRVVEADTHRFCPVCNVCKIRPASVVLLPCRHLCVCAACDGSVANCPTCFAMKDESVEVLLS